MNETLIMVSALFLLLFAMLSIFDGVYFHLWKFKLQEKIDSKFEHLTHTGRAILFIPTILFIYIIGMKGVWAWLTVFVLFLDFIVEIIDVLDEKASREKIGGLPSREYLLHIMLTTVRVTTITLAFAALPVEAWDLNSSVQIEVPSMVRLIAYNLLPGAILMAVLHVYLIIDPFVITRFEKMACSLFCKKMKI